MKIIWPVAKVPVGKAINDKLVHKVRHNPVHEIPTRHDLIFQ